MCTSCSTLTRLPSRCMAIHSRPDYGTADSRTGYIARGSSLARVSDLRRCCFRPVFSFLSLPSLGACCGAYLVVLRGLQSFLRLLLLLLMLLVLMIVLLLVLLLMLLVLLAVLLLVMLLDSHHLLCPTPVLPGRD